MRVDARSGQRMANSWCKRDRKRPKVDHKKNGFLENPIISTVGWASRNARLSLTALPGQFLDRMAAVVVERRVAEAMLDRAHAPFGAGSAYLLLHAVIIAADIAVLGRIDCH
jgi:hypothetical protein